MGTFFMILALLALVALVIGMFNPQAVKCHSRGRVALIYVSAFLVFLIVGGALLPEPEENGESDSQEIVSSATADSLEESVAKNEEPSPKTSGRTKREKDGKSKKSDLYAEEEESAIGQEVKIGHFVYVVNGISFKKRIGDDIINETADGVYLLINLSIKNISKETKMLDNSSFVLTDKNNVKYEYAMNASATLELSGYKTLFLKECQPSILTKGWLVFEVPYPDEYYLHLVGSFWGGKSKKILLK